MATIWEDCWRREKCIRVLGRRACASATACIRILDENGVLKIELQIGNNKIVKDLLDTCYPVYEVGIARLNVCVREIRIVGRRLQSIKLTAELCIGTSLLGRRVEKCWTLIDQTLKFAFVPLSELRAQLGEAFAIDKSLNDAIHLSEDEVVVVTLDDADDDGGRSHIEALFGARVVNNYPQAVQCWTGEPKPSTGNNNFFDVAGNGGVSPGDVDVDHVKDPSGQWWKCGEDLLGRRTVFIERSGAVRSAECRTSGPNKPCGQ
ncbi:MAG: hypothetical protein HYV60_23430 [Planctomycetia bacterium]|nr:hypothetical protein [Planctomycetia bacterium]